MTLPNPSNESTETILTTCYRHPDRPTGLRCSRCLKPICADCARSSPIGYRCPDCIREGEKRFDTALPRDYLFAGIVAFVVAALGAFICDWIPFFPIWTNLLMGGLTGTGIANAVRYVTQKRRSRNLIAMTIGIAAVAVVLVRSLQLFIGLSWFDWLMTIVFIAVMAQSIAMNFGTTFRFPGWK